jgi:Co/Zn/Cd efflux system component
MAADMTPLELELLRMAAPIASSVLAIGSGIAIAAIKWYWGSVVRRMDSIASAVSAVDARLGTIENEMRAQIAEIRSQTQHRDDVMAGNVAARLERIEGICETQHGIQPLRRRDDSKASASWLQSSDITGGKHK